METDEFGRDDPAAIERERRRQEREARRRKRDPGPSEPKPSKASATEGGPEPAPRAPAQRGIGRRAAAGRESLRRRLARGGGKPPRTPAADGGDGGGRPPRRPSGGGGEGGGPRRRPRAANYRARRIAALGFALAGILIAWFLIAFFQPFAGEGLGEGDVAVEIPEGSDAGEIASLLEEQGVVSSARLFEWRLRLADKGDEIQADTYNLAQDMSYGAAIDRLTGEDTGGLLTVTIPEGLDRRQIAADVLPEGVSSEEYLQLTETAPQGFNPARYGAKNRNLEGFLFPATYELKKGRPVSRLVDEQLEHFKRSFTKVDLSFAKKKNLNAYDVLIIASLIEREAMVAKERPLIASVIYNRLREGIPLGIDATVRFVTGNWKRPLRQSELDNPSPYNTRQVAGLPPGPIGNPGLDSIRAAARPAKSNYLFYVVKVDSCGEHKFAETDAEFQAYVNEYNRAREARGGKSPTKC